MHQVQVVRHPLLQHKLTHLRSKLTPSAQFRSLLREISMLLAYEATKDLEMHPTPIDTPICPMQSEIIAGKKLALVAILRAGLGMVEGILELVPNACVGHIGIARDHDTFLPKEYYFNLPKNMNERELFILDPMLATGGSLIHALDRILEKASPKKIKILSIIAAPEGLRNVISKHPNVNFFLGSIDEKLNENAYIIPGLGDAGDRFFGTA